MSRQFVSLYMDEDVDVLVATLIRARGFDVVTTQEAGSLGVHDIDQLGHAASEGRAMFTHNRVDFEAAATSFFSESRDHKGIIIAVRRPPYDVARRLAVLLNQVSASELVNQIRYI